MKRIFTSKKSLIFVATLLLLSAFVLFLGKNSADNQAKAYQEQVNKLSSQADELKQQTNTVAFAEKIVVGRAETESELSGITAECDKLSGVAQSAKDISVVSELSGHPFAFLSGAYQSAKSPFDSAAVRSLMTDSSKLARACERYVADVKKFSEYDKFRAEREALTQPAGESCGSDSGCLRPEDELEYKKYYQEVVLASKAAIKSLEEGCAFPEIQEICDILFTYSKQDLALQETYINALGSGDVSEESNAFSSNPYPEDALCAAAARIMGDSGATENCYTVAYKFVAAEYQQRIKEEAAEL